MALAHPTRQQRRRQRRELLDRGRKAMARGLVSAFSPEDALAIAMVMAETLSDAARPHRAADLAASAKSLLDRSIAPDIRQNAIGCYKGCSHCCSQLVIATAPEIFQVVRWLTDNPQAHATLAGPAFDEETRRRGAMSKTELESLHAPCPLLFQHACGIYEGRPLPCRALLSLSAEACRLGWLEGRGEVPLLNAPMGKAEVVRTIMLSAVTAAGLPDHGYELAGTAAHILTIPDAERRWLAGEDIFAGLVASPRAPSSRQMQDRLAAQIKELS